MRSKIISKNIDADPVLVNKIKIKTILCVYTKLHEIQICINMLKLLKLYSEKGPKNSKIKLL